MSNLQREKTPLKLGMEKEKGKRGGKLEGGGRKKEKKISVSNVHLQLL